jgi:hypothetical protein
MAGVPSKIVTDKIKSVSSKNVPYWYNKSKVSLEGPRDSGTMTEKDIPRKPIPTLRSRPRSKTYGVTQPAGTGKNIAGIYEMGEGVNKKYVTVPEPNNDRRTNVGGTQSNVTPAVGQYAGESRPAPKKGLAASLVKASKSAPKTEPKPKTKIRPYT